MSPERISGIVLKNKTKQKKNNLFLRLHLNESREGFRPSSEKQNKQKKPLFLRLHLNERVSGLALKTKTKTTTTVFKVTLELSG